MADVEKAKNILHRARAAYLRHDLGSAYIDEALAALGEEERGEEQWVLYHDDNRIENTRGELIARASGEKLGMRIIILPQLERAAKRLLDACSYANGEPISLSGSCEAYFLAHRALRNLLKDNADG